MLSILLESAFRSLAVAVAVGAILAVGRVRNPFVLRACWVVVLLTSLAMPMLMQLKPIAIPATALPAVWSSAELASVTVVSTDWQAMFVAIYFLVGGALLARLAIGLIQTWRLSHSAQRVTAQWCAGLDVRATAAIRAPVTFASTILLPSDWVNWNAPKRHAVVAHESAHVRHHDFHLQLLAQVHRAFFWFSPLAWWLPKHLGNLNELISDDAAIAHIADRTSYAHILFEVASDAHRVPTALSMAQPATVMARVDRVLSETKLSSPLRRFAQVGIAISLMPVIAIAASTSAARNVEMQSMQIVQRQAATAEKPAQAKRGVVEVAPSYVEGQIPTLPAYPKESLLKGETGITFLDVLIGSDGAVLEVKLKKSSGHPALDDTAIAHVRAEFRLKPGTIDGVPQPMWVTVPIVFKLKNGKPETAPETSEDKSTAATV